MYKNNYLNEGKIFIENLLKLYFPDNKIIYVV